MSIIVPEFLDKDGDIRPELLDDDAQKVAAALKRERITTHQVRKFYDEVKKYKLLLENDKQSYKNIKPLIVMLKSKAKYAATKKKDMRIFYEFIEKSINQIKKGGEEIEKKKFWL